MTSISVDPELHATSDVVWVEGQLVQKVCAYVWGEKERGGWVRKIERGGERERERERERTSLVVWLKNLDV
jgi:hypothetical protein